MKSPSAEYTITVLPRAGDAIICLPAQVSSSKTYHQWPDEKPNIGVL